MPQPLPRNEITGAIVKVRVYITVSRSVFIKTANFYKQEDFIAALRFVTLTFVELGENCFGGTVCFLACFMLFLGANLEVIGPLMLVIRPWSDSIKVYNENQTRRPL